MHLNVPAILVELKGFNCVNLARIISEHMLKGFSHLVRSFCFLHDWLPVCLSVFSTLHMKALTDDSEHCYVA